MTNVLEKRLEKHIAKHNHKHVNKILRKINTFEHTMMHIGELIMVICIGRGSILFANYNTSYQMFHRENISEANIYLQKAEKIGKPIGENLISTRYIDSKVHNTFATGYCTYGVARISPEFFPYSEDKTTQQRTWGGNAIDRCENAEAAGFNIGANARVGALIVYNPGNGISSLGHVGKVMFYNNKTNYLIVRDMNRITKNTMADHRDNTTTANVKCYIYPKTNTQTSDIPTIIPQPEPNNSNTNKGSQVATKPITSDNEGKTSTEDIETNTEDETISTPEISIPEPIITGEQHNTAPNQNWEEEKPIIEESPETNSEIELNLDNISDISKHFMNQYDFTITKINPKTLKVGDTVNFIIGIQEKTTKSFYNGILPFTLNILRSNNSISIDTSRIQMLQGEEFKISIKILEKINSSIVVMLDDTKITQFEINVN